jgi:hypothetical protein
MSQANTDNSTTSRRRFLTVAAAAIPAVSLASSDIDPIFAAIEAHRQAVENIGNVCRENLHLEEATAKHAFCNAIEAETAVARELAGTLPTTPLGVAAFLTYVARNPSFPNSTVTTAWRSPSNFSLWKIARLRP